METAGLRGPSAPVGRGGMDMCFDGFISRSSWEEVDWLELPTGDPADSVSKTSHGLRSPNSPLIDVGLLRPDSYDLSTSLPLSEIRAVSGTE